MLALIARHWPAARAESSGGFTTFCVLLAGQPQQVPQARPAALMPARL